MVRRGGRGCGTSGGEGALGVVPRREQRAPLDVHLHDTIRESHEERRYSMLGPTQSRISPSLLEYTKVIWCWWVVDKICNHWVVRAGQPLDINVQRFRGGLVFKAHRLVFHSALGL